jgi:hypothetical protein
MQKFLIFEIKVVAMLSVFDIIRVSQVGREQFDIFLTNGGFYHEQIKLQNNRKY